MNLGVSSTYSKNHTPSLPEPLGEGGTQICRCTHVSTMVLKYTPKYTLVLVQKSPQTRILPQI